MNLSKKIVLMGIFALVMQSPRLSAMLTQPNAFIQRWYNFSNVLNSPITPLLAKLNIKIPLTKKTITFDPNVFVNKLKNPLIKPEKPKKKEFIYVDQRTDEEKKAAEERSRIEEKISDLCRNSGPLYKAIEEDQIDTFKELLKNPNYKEYIEFSGNSYGTPFERATINGYWKAKKFLEELVRIHADINAHAAKNLPIASIIHAGDLEFLEKVIKTYPYINWDLTPNDNQNTYLDHAMAFYHNYPGTRAEKLIELVVQNTSRLEDDDLLSALHIAKRGLDYSNERTSGFSPTYIEDLKQAQKNKNVDLEKIAQKYKLLTEKTRPIWTFLKEKIAARKKVWEKNRNDNPKEYQQFKTILKELFHDSKKFLLLSPKERLNLINFMRASSQKYGYTLPLGNEISLLLGRDDSKISSILESFPISQGHTDKIKWVKEVLIPQWNIFGKGPHSMSKLRKMLSTFSELRRDLHDIPKDFLEKVYLWMTANPKDAYDQLIAEVKMQEMLEEKNKIKKE